MKLVAAVAIKAAEESLAELKREQGLLAAECHLEALGLSGES